MLYTPQQSRVEELQNQMIEKMAHYMNKEQMHLCQIHRTWRQSPTNSMILLKRRGLGHDVEFRQGSHTSDRTSKTSKVKYTIHQPKVEQEQRTQ